ncbi:MAG: hypothetical protein ACLPN5_16765 [Roseiarcus sp.]
MALSVIRAKGLDEADSVLLNKLVFRISQALSIEAKRGKKSRCREKARA